MPKTPSKVLPVDLVKLDSAMKEARKWAKTYKAITGKNSSLLADIAEFDAAKRLNLILNQGGSSGYQGERLNKGKLDFVVIKGKQTRTEGSSEGIGKFTLSGPWTSAALVLLNGDFQATSIYVASKSKLKELVAAAEAKAKKDGKKAPGLTLGDFKSIAGKPAWSAK